MNKTKLLIVEDEPTLLETLKYNLKKQGYEVVTAADGAQALPTARAEKPDLVILDVMLPGLDGFEICRILRQEMSLPILMLTARDEEVDKIVGLEVGADDYLTKPFSMRELLARVKAHLRRVRLIREEMETSGQVLRGNAGQWNDIHIRRSGDQREPLGGTARRKSVGVETERV